MSSSTSSLPSASSGARPNPVVADHQTLIDQLKVILSRSSPVNLTSTDLQLVFTSLASPASSSLSSSARSLSLAILARAYPSTPTLHPSKEDLKTLTDTLTSLLSGTDSNDLVSGLSALSALMQVSPTWTTVTLLSSSESTTLVQHLISTVEHISTNTSSTGNSKGKELQLREQVALIELLSIASGQSKLRKLIRDSSNDWLDSLLGSPKKKKNDGSSEKLIKSMAALTIVKLRLGTEPPEQGGATTTSSVIKEEQEVPKWNLEDLCGVFSELFVEETKPEGTISLPLDPTKEAVLLASLEGLAYLTLVPTAALKDQLVSKDGEFLRLFLALLPKLYSKPTGKSSTPALDFSIATLLSHLVKFPEPLDSTSDQAQLNRLKNFASAQAKSSPLQTSETETKEQVTSRMDRIISASPIPTLRHFCSSSSLQTRRLAGKILHALVTPQAKRGLLLQAGVARLLLFLIRRQPTPISIEEGDVEPIQALTKLLISTNPSLVFPDPSLLLEALNIISIPLKTTTPSTTTLPLLTIFESLMALTNLTSLTTELSNHLASTEQGILKSLHEESLICSQHPMIQRASTELVCNLVNSPNGLKFYSVGSSTSKTFQRLSILLALCSSEDGPTRLAASGALAILCSHSEEISFALCLEQGMNGLGRMKELVKEEDEGLRHRGLDMLSSILGVMERCEVVEKRKEGLKRLKKGDILRSIKECEKSEKVGMLKDLAREDRKVLEKLLGI